MSRTDGDLQDQGILAECESTVQKTIDGLGGIDIIVSNAVSRLSPNHGGTSPLSRLSVGLDQIYPIR